MVGALLSVRWLLAEDDSAMFLGDDFFPWMVLALGAAMIVGNVVALVRPPRPKDGSTAGPPPVGRAATMIVVGVLAAIWGLASLLS